MNTHSALVQVKSTPEFLRVWLDLQKAKNPRFGIRAACKLLGVGHGTLSNILSERRRLSMGLAVRIAEKMHLDEASKKHFLLLNTLQEMDSLRAQREVQHKIKRNIESIFLSQGENSGDSVLMALESVELGPQELASLKREITDVIQRYVERKGSSLSVSQ